MFKVGKFIVIPRGDDIRNYRSNEYDRGKDWFICEYAVSGQVVFNIGEAVPVIESGNTCIGMGVPQEILIRESTTIIVFKFTRSNDQAFCKALYKYYQMQSGGAVSSGESSQGSGFILPGLDMGASESSSKKKRHGHYDPYGDDDDYIGY